MTGLFEKGIAPPGSIRGLGFPGQFGISNGGVYDL